MPESALLLGGVGVFLGAVVLLLILFVVQSRQSRSLIEQRVWTSQNQVFEAQASQARELERVFSTQLAETRIEMAEKMADFATIIGRGQADAQIAQADAMQRLTRANAEQVDLLRVSVGEQLQSSVEKQMSSSFQRVVEQFTAMQKSVGEITAMGSQLADLKRLFSNVKTRGGWGEMQLRAILEDILPPEAIDVNFRIDETRDVVEFALIMPVKGGMAPRLAIDSKFPTEAYERLLNAVEAVDAASERLARKALETTVKAEAKKLKEKYISPPATVDFAVLYLPTDGLYLEVARIPGLIDEVGRLHRVIIMSPSLLPALIRTVHLGWVTLSFEERSEVVAELLSATRQEMLKMDDVMQKLARNVSTLSNTIEDARQRIRVLGSKLKRLDMQEVHEDLEKFDEI